ncbi:LysE family translocator [Parasalinivibrio latis]|uniref:LysE family translocator n=1 Tax=Parasalinivibrio latis TaxID=2952610 RepID=UPI0030E18AF2
MTVTTWMSLIAICILGAMSPGPSLVVVARHTLSGGRLHGIVTCWSHAVGIGIYALLTIMGLAVLIQQSPTVFKVLTFGGAFYLAYMGYKSLTSKGGVASRLEGGKAVTLWQAARDGFAISILNPKIALFFIALFSQFVVEGSSYTDKAIIAVTPFLIDGLWYTIVAFLLSTPGLLERLRRKAVVVDRLCGVMLIGLAARVVVTL